MQHGNDTAIGTQVKATYASHPVKYIKVQIYTFANGYENSEKIGATVELIILPPLQLFLIFDVAGAMESAVSPVRSGSSM